MKLETLTDEQRASLPAKKEYYIAKFLNSDKINRNLADEVIEFVYSLIDLPKPEIVQVISPKAAQDMANKLSETEKKFYPFGTFLTIYWSSFYAFYETFVDFGVVTEENCPNYFKLRKFIDSNMFLTIEFESHIIICEKPLYVKKNDNGMHCLTGPAITWEDGYSQYYINGRNMPEWIFSKYKDGTLTKMDFINEENEDIKAGIYEIIETGGEGSMLTFLGAVEVDKKSIIHTNGEVEELILYKTTEEFEMEEDLNGKSPAALAWLRMTCPSTGQNYLIPSDSSFDDAKEAAKYHRPTLVPRSHDYAWTSRN